MEYVFKHFYFALITVFVIYVIAGNCNYWTGNQIDCVYDNCGDSPYTQGK